MRKFTATALLTIMAALLAGCPRPVRTPEDRPEPSSAPEADTRGAAIYHVNPQQSQVLIHVYRGGTLSRLGHNHIVASKSLSGRVWLHPTFAKSGFELAFPVADLIVDDPDLRRAAGADFTSDVTQSDKQGTRRNMLRAEVLDAERYSEIKMRSARVTGTLASPQVTAYITIRDETREAATPVNIQLDGERLRATGEFDIKQTDFGIKPFSLALGALEVQDRLHIKFSVVAERRQR